MQTIRRADGRRRERANHAIPANAEGRLRPSEKVTRYMVDSFERAKVDGICRLPTVRNLAAQLDVSVFTVHSVFQKLKGEGRIRTEVGNGTFLVAPKIEAKPDVLKVALSIPLVKDVAGAHWGYRIAQGVLSAASKEPQRMMILPLSQQFTEDPSSMTSEILEQRSLVDGLILFPDGPIEEICSAYEEAGKPVIQVSPPSVGATANFVSTDFFGVSRLLGQVWRKTGRTRILLVTGNIMSVSSQLRCFGLMAGLDMEWNRRIRVELVRSASIHEAGGYQAVRDFLKDGGMRPDAIYCVGDPLALGALRALEELGLKVPEEVSVVGGTGMDFPSTPHSQLTRTQQPFEEIGKSLIAMLGHRLEQTGTSVPGQFLPVKFSGGGTTRPEENEKLGVVK